MKKEGDDAKSIVNEEKLISKSHKKYIAPEDQLVCELTERVAEVMANDSGTASRNFLMSVPVPNKLV